MCKTKYLLFLLFSLITYVSIAQSNFVTADEVGSLNNAWEKITINAVLGTICYLLYRELKSAKEALKTLQKEKDEEIKAVNEKLFTFQTTFLSDVKANLQEINRTLNDYGKTIERITYKLP